MKKLFLILVAFVSLIACTTTSPVYLIKTECSNISAEEMVDEMETVLLENNFRINKTDRQRGFIQAERYREGTFVADPGLAQMAQYSGRDDLFMWNIVLTSGSIEATCRKIQVTRTPQGGTQFANEVYYNDELKKSKNWYWNIRDHLDQLCEGQMVIEEVKEEKEQ